MTAEDIRANLCVSLTLVPSLEPHGKLTPMLNNIKCRLRPQAPPTKMLLPSTDISHSEFSSQRSSRCFSSSLPLHHPSLCGCIQNTGRITIALSQLQPTPDPHLRGRSLKASYTFLLEQLPWFAMHILKKLFHSASKTSHTSPEPGGHPHQVLWAPLGPLRLYD